MVRIIGDIHGDFNAYRNIIQGVPESIQVGDFGMGFGPSPMDVPLYHRYIRGNHDDLDKCKEDHHWIKDGSILSTKLGNAMCVGGAYSIDQAARTEGIDWWRNEELSIVELNKIHGTFLQTHPEIMITHTCPKQVASHLFSFGGDQPNSVTEQAFDSFFMDYQPKLWVFGHFHEYKKETIKGTVFICLPPLSSMDLDL